MSISLESSVILAVQIVLFATCLIENSIAIFILHKNLKNGRKTFSQYILINVACSDILNALISFPVRCVRLYYGEFVWLVGGQAGDVLCELLVFVSEVPFKALALCLVALACDVTRNLSAKGRREHTRKFSAIIMIFFWIIATASSYMYKGKVKLEKCWIDPSKLDIIDLILRYVFVAPAISILVILNLIIFRQVKRRKKEITQKRKERKAGRMKVPEVPGQSAEQRKRIVYLKNVGELIEEYFVVEASQQTSRNIGSETVVPAESKTLSDESDNSDLDVDEEGLGADQSALKENFAVTREEAKIERIISFIYVVLMIIFLSLPSICEHLSSCSDYVFLVFYLALDFYGVIKPGIYAYTDKEFRKRYKQLSPFACCCFRRIQCHTVREQVGTRNSRPTQETSL